MKKIKSFIASLTTAVLLTGLAINFNACTEQSPLASVEDEAQDSVSLAKHRSYPQSASLTLSTKGNGSYKGGKINVPGGSSFHVRNGAFIPPKRTLEGADVTLTMFAERSEYNYNEIIFTFKPSGSQFNPSAEVWLDWNDLGSPNATLYYIDENDNYIPQEPDDVDLQGKRLKLSIDHFSRYAIGAE